MGYSTFWLHKDETAPDLINGISPVSVSQDGGRMANEFVEVLFDVNNGFISDIYDKKHDAHAINGPCAVGLVIDETHSDTWGHGLREYRDIVGSFGKTAVEVIESGPVRCKVRITGSYHESILIQEFMLYHDRPEIEVKVNVHWKEKHKMLKLEFPIVSADTRSVSEIPYGYIDRLMDGSEKPIQRWTDVSGSGYGVSIINDSTHSIDVNDGAIRLTVLRSPIYADHFGERDDLCEFMEQGEHEVRYMIFPHAGDWRDAGTVRRAMVFNMPVSVVYETYHTGPLPQVFSGIQMKPENIVTTAFKMAEDGSGYILRCHETSGWETDAEIDLPLLGRNWNTHFGSSEIKTLLIPFDAETGVREVNLLEM
jgi:alpha-mannosidase